MFWKIFCDSPYTCLTLLLTNAAVQFFRDLVREYILRTRHVFFGLFLSLTYENNFFFFINKYFLLLVVVVPLTTTNLLRAPQQVLLVQRTSHGRRLFLTVQPLALAAHVLLQRAVVDPEPRQVRAHLRRVHSATREAALENTTKSRTGPASTVGWLRLVQTASFHPGSRILCVSESYTSKQCGGCGVLNETLADSKTFTCTPCVLEADRDIYAARNILLRTRRLRQRM